MRRFPTAFAPAVAAILPILAPALAHAQTATAPEVVVTATRVPTPLDEIPAGVTVITRAEIETRGYETLVDALSAVPGLRVVQSGGPGGNASVFIRGTNSDHVLVLRDGFPLNDAADANAAFNFGIDTLADVERIEIVRGPMASLYGSGAIGGVINIITRRGHEEGVHFDGSIAGGYPRNVIGDATASGIQGPLDYALTFQSQSFVGFDYTPPREVIYSGVPQGFTEQIVTLNLGATPVEGTRLSLLFRARGAEFGFNALGSPTFDDSNSSGHDAQMLGRIGVTSHLFGDLWETGLYLGRLQDDRKYTELLNPDDPNMATNDSRYHGYRTDVQWNNTLRLAPLIASPSLTAVDLTFGYEHTSDSAKVRVNSSSFGYPYQQAANAHQDLDAGYAGLQVNFLDRLTLTGQVREDAVLNDTPFTWRAGGVVAVPEIGAHLKAAYGTAFRAPSLFDRYGVDSSGFVGNPLLRPEKARGYEAGATFDVPLLGRPYWATIGATYFNEQVTDLIVTNFNTSTPYYTEENIGAAHLQGVETELTWRPAAWLTVDATWTYTQAEDADTGERLLRRPQNTVSIDARATPIPNLTIAPELTYTGRFQDYLIEDSGNSDGIGSSKPGTIVNVAVTYQVHPQVQVFAKGSNIFDSKFEPANGYLTPGASFLAGVRARY